MLCKVVLAFEPVNEFPKCNCFKKDFLKKKIDVLVTEHQIPYLPPFAVHKVNYEFVFLVFSHVAL